MPQIRMRDASGVLRTITQVRMRDAAAVLRDIQRVRMRDAAGTLRTVFEYFSLTLNTTIAYGNDNGASSSGLVTTNAVTATVVGGAAPITYLWERVSGVPITPDTPNAADTTFTTTAYTTPITGFYRLKATDNNGSIIYSPLVEVTIVWIDTR